VDYRNLHPKESTSARIQADTSADEARRARGRRLRIVRAWIGRAAMGLLGAGVLFAIIAGALPKPVPVDIGQARRGALRITVNEDGRTRVKDRYTISSPLTGNLARIELRPGDTVQKGQVLLRIQPLDAPLLDTRTRAEAEARLAAAQAALLQARSAVGRAQAGLDFARSEAQKNRQLAARGAVPLQALERSQLEERTRAEEFSSSQFGVKVAEHQAELARAALQQISGGGGRRPGAAGLEVVAPLDADGRVLRVFQTSAGVVQAGTALMEVGDPAALEIVVDVLTQDAIQIQPGAKAVIERWGGPQDLRAHVRVVEPSAFTRVSALGVEEQRVNVVLDLDEPREKWAQLGDGYRVECRIIVWEGADVVSVPLSALFRDGERWAVYVVKDERAVLRHIGLGHRGDMEAEVAEGLAAGEAVVLHPSEQVKAGVKLEKR
jgi:HlyD family secretion protein